jgi:hypothetical protein
LIVSVAGRVQDATGTAFDAAQPVDSPNLALAKYAANIGVNDDLALVPIVAQSDFHRVLLMSARRHLPMNIESRFWIVDQLACMDFKPRQGIFWILIGRQVWLDIAQPMAPASLKKRIAVIGHVLSCRAFSHDATP